jgi:hypothetical protein
MRSSLLLLSVLSNTILVAHSYVALRPFAAAAFASASAISSTRSSLQLDASALEDNSNSNGDPAVESWDWEQLASSAFETDERPIIMFDGKCNLCNGGVNFALDHDPNGM